MEKQNNPTGRLLLEMPNGKIVPIAVTYHFPEGHELEGLMMPNFWMYEGYMAAITPDPDLIENQALKYLENKKTHTTVRDAPEEGGE